jgi:hypothetical protein
MNFELKKSTFLFSEATPVNNVQECFTCVQVKSPHKCAQRRYERINYHRHTIIKKEKGC